MVVPVTADRRLVLVRQYRHNLKSYQFEFPAGTMHQTEDPGHPARRAELAGMSWFAGQVGVAQFYLPAADEEGAEVDDQ
jgi:8-oxo-dGTP pyrophosphatase MutT (NUDIX family)